MGGSRSAGGYPSARAARIPRPRSDGFAGHEPRAVSNGRGTALPTLRVRSESGFAIWSPPIPSGISGVSLGLGRGRSWTRRRCFCRRGSPPRRAGARCRRRGRPTGSAAHPWHRQKRGRQHAAPAWRQRCLERSERLLGDVDGSLSALLAEEGEGGLLRLLFVHADEQELDALRGEARAEAHQHG